MISKLLETLSFPIYESIVYILFPGIVILYIFNWWFSEIIVASKYRSKGHSWRSIQLSKSIPYNVLCSVCERLMLSAVGHYCERCAMSACRGCRRNANRKTSCRVTTAPHGQPFTHNWVKVGAACDECGVGITEDKGCDYFCCWCQRIQHCASGLPSEVEVCDFGKFRSMILPPSSVSIDRKGVVSIQPPDWPDWQPLIVIGNPKSGGQSGDEVLSFFRGYLNPLQVVRLGRAGLATALRWIPSNSRVLIAGGDGSVAAVLTAITDAGIKPAPPVGILPLGTGNDLSRVLGWGGACPVPLSPRSLFDDIKQAIPETIDRWSVRVGRRQLFAYNYVSVGVDARVALDFHRARRHPLYLCGSQTINYLIYLFLGTQQAVSQDCLGLEKILELKLDGVDIPLPSLQALLLLNIPSWGAGVDVWNGGANTTVAAQSFNDGRFEVLGITSSFHIAQLSIGLSQPMRLGQGSTAVIKMKGKAPMQVDGEPWEQGPCEIVLEQAGSAVVLCRNSTLPIS